MTGQCMQDLAFHIGKLLNNWFPRQLQILLDMVGGILDKGTGCVFGSPGDWIHSKRTISKTIEAAF